MGSKPRVSVVMIFWNAERFIREAIESVFAQTYERWELLLVDDGSTDGSSAIALYYAQRYPEKVRYLAHACHANRGKSISRNLGIQHAKGEYLTFLDADDVLLPEKLERQTAILDSQPVAAMVYGASQYWYSWTGSPQAHRRDARGTLGVQPDRLFYPPRLLTLFVKDGGIVPCLCGLLARRKVVEDIGGFEETIQHLYEDQVLLAKICLQAPVFVESGCGERYRQHPASSSYLAIRRGEYHPIWPNPAHLTFVNWLVNYVTRQRIKDVHLWKALQRALWLYRHPNLGILLKMPQYLLYQAKQHIMLSAQRFLPVPVYHWFVSR
jgi:glycosyltransferase involved in cell wall biosynthesis